MRTAGQPFINFLPHTRGSRCRTLLHVVFLSSVRPTMSRSRRCRQSSRLVSCERKDHNHASDECAAAVRQTPVSERAPASLPVGDGSNSSVRSRWTPRTGSSGSFLVNANPRAVSNDSRASGPRADRSHRRRKVEAPLARPTLGDLRRVAGPDMIAWFCRPAASVPCRGSSVGRARD
jgi:hypothetical protein